MLTYRFAIGAKVLIRRTNKDPGGVGTVTAREQKEDDRGLEILYRVLIEGHEGQARAAKDKRRRNAGFWYKDTLVQEA